MFWLVTIKGTNFVQHGRVPESCAKATTYKRIKDVDALGEFKAGAEFTDYAETKLFEIFGKVPRDDSMLFTTEAPTRWRAGKPTVEEVIRYKRSADIEGCSFDAKEALRKALSGGYLVATEALEALKAEFGPECLKPKKPDLVQGEFTRYQWSILLDGLVALNETAQKCGAKNVDACVIYDVIEELVK